MAATFERGTRPDVGWWIKQGIIGGIIAGIVFAMFEMIVAALMMGAAAFWMPLRMIGAMVLGATALEPTYDLVTAAVTGVLVHLVLAALFGVIFALIVAFVPALASSAAMLITAASVYGLLLWLVNFSLIAPAAGWVWFPNETNPVVQFLAHTFFYGSALGLYLNAVRVSAPTFGRALATT
ncbi:MAG: hypothetical protein HY332_03585 [Chloroflexi bacterium]|nr:hypothetical protein [Chloroflexota bacterium]